LMCPLRCSPLSSKVSQDETDQSLELNFSSVAQNVLDKKVTHSPVFHPQFQLRGRHRLPRGFFHRGLRRGRTYSCQLLPGHLPHALKGRRLVPNGSYAQHTLRYPLRPLARMTVALSLMFKDAFVSAEVEKPQETQRKTL
jgi:hypothetical protein